MPEYDHDAVDRARAWSIGMIEGVYGGPHQSSFRVGSI